LIDFAKRLSTNSTNANAGNLTGNRMFYANDYMVHRGRNYVTSVKMYSSRTTNTECTNSQNPFGFHLSDGVVYTYLDGDEYEDIAAAWDWNLIPGITTDYNATILNCSNTSHSGVESFVGGVSDNATGVAVMRYTNPLTSSLRWQKVWFFLENDIQHVMVSNISSATRAPVYTILDQKRYKGEIIVNEEEYDGIERERDVRSLWHANVGYVFSDLNDKASLTVRVGEKTGNWSTVGTSAWPPNTVNLFTAWIQHDDISAPISYTVFPGTDELQFQQRSLQLRLREIQNDETISAIYDDSAQMAMIVFWEFDGGSVTFTPRASCAPITISSTGNIALIYRLDLGVITVSDPSQTLNNVTVTLTVGYGRKPPRWGSGRNKDLFFDLPTDEKIGSSVTQALY